MVGWFAKTGVLMAAAKRGKAPRRPANALGSQDAGSAREA